MTVLAAGVIALFLYLGLWQIRRGEEKQQQLTAETVLSKQSPLKFSSDKLIPKPYQRVIVEGTFLPNIFLLDNQHYQHQFGYDVLSPLLLSDGKVIMVNRGWVLADITRQTFPQINTSTQPIKLAGSAYFPSQKQWVLGPSMEEKGAYLTVVEILDINLFSKVLQKKLYPFIIRLDKQDPHGFVREWKIVSMPPARHRAYALQWFAMALVVFIIYIALNLKKNDEEKS